MRLSSRPSSSRREPHKVQAEAPQALTPGHSEHVELDRTLRTWKTISDDLYGGDAPAATLSLTIEAATGLVIANPFWVACVGGETAESGPPSTFEAGRPDVPRGASSWSDVQLKLPVHDVTADLLLLLCEESAAGRRCVGRVFVPLVDLIPLKSFLPFATPVQHRLWAAVLPPAGEYAAAEVHGMLEAAIPGVVGIGMRAPATGSLGRALLRIELTLQRSLVHSYTFVPPFRHPTAATAERPLAPERLGVTAARIGRLLCGTPPLLRLVALRPWSVGAVVLLMTVWLLYFSSAAGLPWWLLCAWLLNGLSVRALASSQPQPWEPRHPPSSAATARSAADTTADAQLVRLEAKVIEGEGDPISRLEAKVRPILSAIDGVAAVVERVVYAPAAEAHAALFVALPLGIVATFFASIVLRLFAWTVALCGGARAALLEAVTACLVVNAASFHRAELLLWLGASPDEAEAALLPRSTPRSAVSVTPADVNGELPAALPQWLAADRRKAIEAVSTCGSRFWEGLVGLAYNLFTRLPDMPLIEHRAMARARLQPVPTDDADAPPLADHDPMAA